MLEFPLYLPDPTEPDGVILWGKPPGQREKDTAAGVARLGGDRWANYGQAYLLAAATLFKAAKAHQSLDHYGLPIFYLQRHATELLLKEILQLAIEIQDLRTGAGAIALQFPTAKQRRNAYSSHNLFDLGEDLTEMAKAMNLGLVPPELKSIIQDIESIEKQSETWSRYSIGRSKGPGGNAPKHLESEVILPLGHLQDMLEAANKSMGKMWNGEGLLGQLGELHQDAARNAGLID
ncbi:hypothetical protein HNP48_005212 [Acidovorax soli]|uniref:Uncharacterized protein n=1 Tax=Acidovorax soli TaxID=592050 RepID=A0A7X0UBZ6_9BURK|nr:hypothetical protein [Acidovorax soli]MBB6562499.1 hypothetical protein [Acidovorax soli]